MKKSFTRPPLTRNSGFTLVELLVVIAIIAVLASVIMGAATMAMRAAQRAKTYNLCSQIQSGAMNYYTEYSLYPIPSNFVQPATPVDYYISDSSAAASAANWKALLFGLCGNVNPYDGTATVPTGAVANSHAVAFLTLKTSDVDVNGGPKSSLSFNSIANPYLNIVLDTDYDNIIGDSGTGVGQVPNFNTSKLGAMANYTAALGPSGGVAVWANCNTTTVAASTNPNFFVRTY